MIASCLAASASRRFVVAPPRQDSRLDGAAASLGDDVVARRGVHGDGRRTATPRRIPAARYGLGQHSAASSRRMTGRQSRDHGVIPVAEQLDRLVQITRRTLRHGPRNRRHEASMMAVSEFLEASAARFGDSSSRASANRPWSSRMRPMPPRRRSARHSAGHLLTGLELRRSPPRPGSGRTPWTRPWPSGLRLATIRGPRTSVDAATFARASWPRPPAHGEQDERAPSSG